MKLKLDNKKDIYKFYKMIFLYKSFIFYNVKFSTKCNNNDIKLIIDGLNIKNRKKRTIYVYDTACKIIDNKNYGVNICGFKNNKCYTQRNDTTGKCFGCCRLCIYRSNKGCTTKNLTCKFFNCSEVTKRHKVITYNDLKILKLFSLRQRMIIKHDYFCSRRMVISDLLSYGFIYTSVKIYIRFIKNIIKAKKIDKENRKEYN